MDETIMTMIFSGAELLVLIATIITTIIIYDHQKRTERQHAAQMIIMQIDSINRNTDLIMNILGDDVRKFHVAGFWKAENIVDSNLWEKNRHLFAKKMEYDQIVALNIFYENALLATIQQKEIKMLISEINKSFYIDVSKMNQEEHDDALKSHKPYIGCSIIYLETIQEQCRMIVKNRGAIPYQKLRKIAKI